MQILYFSYSVDMQHKYNFSNLAVQLIYHTNKTSLSAYFCDLPDKYNFSYLTILFIYHRNIICLFLIVLMSDLVTLADGNNFMCFFSASDYLPILLNITSSMPPVFSPLHYI